MANNVKIKPYASLDDAATGAYKTVQAIGGRVFPITLFKQGKRQFVSAVFPVNFIINELKTNSTEKDKGIRDVRSAMNRPIDSPHAKNTKEYLLKNYQSNYILPPMTLNIQDAVELHIFEVTGNYLHPGYLAIPYGIKLSITDGQHRKKALEELQKELKPEEFALIQNDGISVMITIEDSLTQVHQDFADCSKTKALPKSLIAVYDKRNAANGLVIDLIDACPLFMEKVDATRQNLSKNSVKLFLVSQIRSFVKELCLGNSALGDVDFENKAVHLFTDANSATYKQTLKNFKDFINKVTDKIEILKTVSTLKEGVEMSRIPALRSEYLILNSAGLNIIGRIFNAMVAHKYTSTEIDFYINKLAAINWRKDANIWRNNIVNKTEKGYKIANSNLSMKEAAKAVMKEIGLNLDNQKTEGLIATQ